MSFGTNQSSSGTDIITSNLATGGAVGAAAYVVGYILTFVFITIDGVEPGEVDSWKVVGWVFYGEHNVDIETTISAGGRSETETTSIFGGEITGDLTSTIPEFLYLLLPVVVLVGAGFLVYTMVGRRLETGAAAGVGASVAVGYLVLAVIGTFLFEASQSAALGEVTFGPEMTTGILVAGIVYPVVFGAIGGVVGRSVSD